MADGIATSARRVSTISTSQVVDCLTMCKEAGAAVLLWGPPGVGKSAIVRQFAERVARLPLFEISLSQYEPVDMKGIPGLVDGDDAMGRPSRFTRFFPPDFLPRTPAVIFFDELGSALPATQVACQRIVLDRSLEGWRAHEETFIVAASNRRADKTGVHALPLALDNRLVHFDVVPNVTGWIEWLLMTKTRDEAERAAAALVASFAGFRPDMTHCLDGHGAASDVHGFPTFRSWEKVCDFLAHRIRKVGRPDADPILSACIQGVIGVSAGLMFGAFLRLQSSLACLKDILAGRDFELPKNVDSRWALVGALAQRSGNGHARNIWRVVEAFERAEAGELAIHLVRQCKVVNRAFVMSPEFEAWAARHPELVR